MGVRKRWHYENHNGMRNGLYKVETLTLAEWEAGKRPEMVEVAPYDYRCLYTECFNTPEKAAAFLARSATCQGCEFTDLCPGTEDECERHMLERITRPLPLADGGDADE